MSGMKCNLTGKKGIGSESIFMISQNVINYISK